MEICFINKNFNILDSEWSDEYNCMTFCNRKISKTVLIFNMEVVTVRKLNVVSTFRDQK